MNQPRTYRRAFGSWAWKSLAIGVIMFGVAALSMWSLSHRHPDDVMPLGSIYFVLLGSFLWISELLILIGFVNFCCWLANLAFCRR